VKRIIAVKAFGSIRKGWLHMSDPFYAHSRAGEPLERWELLEHHLECVADLAREFAAAFDSPAWGYRAGLWHDLGKYRAEFQRRIHGSGEHAPHAIVGAVQAYERTPPIAFAIAGHHTGLANHTARLDTTQTPLRESVMTNGMLLDAVALVAPARLLDQESLPLPPWLAISDAHERKLRTELWTRFLFSALVDADRLATERFYLGGKRATLDYDTISALRERLDRALSKFSIRTPVDSVRAAVLDDCRTAAEEPPGLFSLTVPTGGGKTLSSMAFALRHAERYGLRRVIVVVPYTSIIEQNAAVYSEHLGARNVIEHHSAIDETTRYENSSELEIHRRLAAENWDAPIVVTTAVQFVESLFSNEPSRCRKLHNITRSVIVIDEAQALPTDFLLCVLDGIRQLTAHYGCSLVLSTATQPALAQRESLPQGLTNVREITRSPGDLQEALRRIDVVWPADTEPTSYDVLSTEIAREPEVLVIVHNRRDARTLAEQLPVDGRFHLSTRMCAAHRLDVLAQVKARLQANATCRLVSTQLVEAGVDIDFPVVYRAMAGLDSLAQAAGRCNRNGLRRDEAGQLCHGRFVVFRAPTPPPAGVLRRGLDVAEGMLADHGLDLADGDTLEQYFRGLYLHSAPDPYGVMGHRAGFNFATVAQLVRLIKEETHPVVVPWGESPARVAAFGKPSSDVPMRVRARALQPFTVQVRQHELKILDTLGAVAPLEGFGHVLAAPYLHLYDPAFGLTIDGESAADVNALIC
jgi:CRISPR-associated endonuclease/helicase Cas3